MQHPRGDELLEDADIARDAGHQVTCPIFIEKAHVLLLDVLVQFIAQPIDRMLTDVGEQVTAQYFIIFEQMFLIEWVEV